MVMKWGTYNYQGNEIRMSRKMCQMKNKLLLFYWKHILAYNDENAGVSPIKNILH